MNLKQIEEFVKIANNHSFSQTAKELFLTQPTVSAGITNLENELGVRLFVRTTKGVEMTNDGKRMYLHARQILESTDAIKQLFGAATIEEPLQQIVLSSSSIPTQYILPSILGEFSRRYPKIQFRMAESDSLGVVNEVVNHTIDIGFTGTVMDRKSCEYFPFYEDELICITPNTEKYREIREKIGFDVEWIEREPIIMRENGSGTREEAIKQLRKLGVAQDNLNIVASIANPNAILTSVRNGIGITFISKLAAQRDLEEGSVLEFPLGEEGLKRQICMVWNSVYPVTDCTKKLIHLVKEMYAKPEEKKPAI